MQTDRKSQEGTLVSWISEIFGQGRYCWISLLYDSTVKSDNRRTYLQCHLRLLRRLPVPVVEVHAIPLRNGDFPKELRTGFSAPIVRTKSLAS